MVIIIINDSMFSKESYRTVYTVWVYFLVKKIRYADIGIKKSLGGCIDDFNYHIQLSFLNFHSVNILW